MTTEDRNEALRSRTFVKTSAASNQNSLLYFGLLAYVVIFYSQIGGRIPVLGMVRIELVVGTVVLLLSFSRVFTGQVRLGENKFNKTALLFFVFLLLSIPLAYVKSRAFETFVDFAKFFSIYFMIIATIDDERQIKGFIIVYLSMIALIFVEPFLLSLKGEGFVYNNHMMRLAGITGYFAHPNQLGMMTSENLPFYYYLSRTTKSKTLKLILFSLIAIGIRVVMLTQSRTGFIGVLTFLLFVWLMSKRKARGLAMLVMAAAVIWIAAPQETKDRFLTFESTAAVIAQGRDSIGEDEGGRLSSIASRWELMQSTFQTFAENPLIGVGLNCSGSYSGRKGGSWFPPHNTYLQALAELGIIGTALFIMVIVFTIRNFRYSKNLLTEMDQKDSYLYHLLSALTVYYVILLIVSAFGIELYANYWWLAGGLSVVIVRTLKVRHKVFISTLPLTPATDGVSRP